LRALLDTNVIISALLSATGAPAQILRAWLDGRFELIVSPSLLAELERALAYPKLRRRISADEADAFVAWLGRTATVVADPDMPPPVRSVDAADDYLLALAAAADVVLVSGDAHLLSLRDQAPIYGAAEFLGLI
jgi:putative PIN family toxin of toxin-antitoxin system